MNERSSPWWYRRRGMVFGIIYGVGFGVGAALWGAFYGGDYMLLVQWVGQRWGSAVAICALILGTALTLLCFLIRLWGTSYLRPAIVWSANARTDVIIIDGPFRFTRNPLYLGNVLLAAGIGVVASPFGWLLLVALHVIFIGMLIRWEERGLRERYGTAFQNYCDLVPRLLPRLKPIPVENPITPSWREGMRGEIFGFVCFLGMLTLFLPIPFPRNMYVFWIVLVVGAILAAVSVRRSRTVANAPQTRC